MSADPEAELRPMPTVVRLCSHCGVDESDLRFGWIVVSPRGTAHHGNDNGDTDCGLNATGDKWWWPL